MVPPTIHAHFGRAASPPYYMLTAYHPPVVPPPTPLSSTLDSRPSTLSPVLTHYPMAHGPQHPIGNHKVIVKDAHEWVRSLMTQDRAETFHPPHTLLPRWHCYLIT